MSFAVCETEMDETYSAILECPIKKECSFISHTEVVLNLLFVSNVFTALRPAQTERKRNLSLMFAILSVMCFLFRFRSM